jgi:hypothetical protein
MLHRSCRLPLRTSLVGLFLLLPAVLRVFICRSLLPSW